MTGELHRKLKSLELTMKEHQCSVEDTILVFDFLSRMVVEFNIPGLTEAQEYVDISQLLTGKVAKQIRS